MNDKITSEYRGLGRKAAWFAKMCADFERMGTGEFTSKYPDYNDFEGTRYIARSRACKGCRCRSSGVTGMTRVCSGCGRHSCRGECYSEEPTPDGKTLDQLMDEHPELRAYQLELRARLNAGLGLVEVEHLKPRGNTNRIAA